MNIILSELYHKRADIIQIMNRKIIYFCKRVQLRKQKRIFSKIILSGTACLDTYSNVLPLPDQEIFFSSHIYASNHFWIAISLLFFSCIILSVISNAFSEKSVSFFPGRRVLNVRHSWFVQRGSLNPRGKENLSIRNN